MVPTWTASDEGDTALSLDSDLCRTLSQYASGDCQATGNKLAGNGIVPKEHPAPTDEDVRAVQDYVARGCPDGPLHPSLEALASAPAPPAKAREAPPPPPPQKSSLVSHSEQNMTLNVTRSRRWRLRETTPPRRRRQRVSRESCGGVGRIDGVFTRPHRRDAVYFNAGAPRESTTTAGRLRRVARQALRRPLLLVAPA